MMHLWEAGAVRQADLIDRLGVDPSTVTKMLSAATAHRQRYPDDGSRRPTRSTRRGNRNQQSPPPRNRSRLGKRVETAHGRRALDPRRARRTAATAGQGCSEFLQLGRDLTDTPATKVGRRIRIAVTATARGDAGSPAAASCIRAIADRVCWGRHQPELVGRPIRVLHSMLSITWSTNHIEEIRS